MDEAAKRIAKISNNLSEFRPWIFRIHGRAPNTSGPHRGGGGLALRASAARPAHHPIQFPIEIENIMSKKAIISEVKTFSCSNSWRNYYFLKITTEDGIVGWSEFDQNFGSPGVEAAIDQIKHRLIGQSAMHHEHIREDLATSRGLAPAASSVRRSARSRTRCSMQRRRRWVCPAMSCSAARSATRSGSTGRTASRTGRAPSISRPRSSTSTAFARSRAMFGSRASQRSRPTYSTTMKRPHQGWSPGFGRPFDAGRNVERGRAKDLRASSGSDSRGGGAGYGYPARPQLQRADRGLSRDRARNR